MPHVKLALGSGIGANHVEVDGVDLTRLISGVSFSRDASEPSSTVVLQLRADVTLDDEVTQVVAVVPGQRPEQALQELLAGVDAGELEQEALGLLGGLEGGPQTPTEAILVVLRKWAAGA